jgi:putative FmdB family regulatory protein
MPIYAYRCESCGFEKDVLQKMSDAPLTQCPACSNDTFRKQVTAAGFQLKGSGWYVTDFRGGSNGANGANGAKSAAANATENAGGDAAKADGGKTEAAASSSADGAASASSTPAAAPAAAGSTGA